MTKKMSAFPAETAIANIVNFIGQIAGPSNVLMTPANAFINLIPKGSALLGVQQITATGTYVPTAGTKKALFIACGAGAGSGGVGSTAAGTDGQGAAGGGGCGELRAVVAAIDTALTYTATVATGGAAATAGNNAGGAASGDTKINNGTADLFVCKPGAAGGGDPGDNSGSGNGANGSGGSGGILLSSLMVSPVRAAFNNQPAGGYNTLFGAPPSILFPYTSSANVLVINKDINGRTGQGKGSGGTGGVHYSASTTTRAGGAGTDGFILVIEFG